MQSNIKRIVTLSKTLNLIMLIGFVTSIPQKKVYKGKVSVWFKLKTCGHNYTEFTHHFIVCEDEVANYILQKNVEINNHLFVLGSIDWYYNPEKERRFYRVYAMQINILDQTYQSCLDKFINEVLKYEEGGIPF